MSGLAEKKVMDLLQEKMERIYSYTALVSSVIFKDDIVEYNIEEDDFGRAKAVDVFVISKHESF